jgi:hypothetical protein
MKILIYGFIVNTNFVANVCLPFENHYFGFVSGDFRAKFFCYKLTSFFTANNIYCLRGFKVWYC